MAEETDLDGGAPADGDDALATLLESANEDVLAGLFDDPRLHEPQLCRLLERRDLPATLLERLARRKHWMASYRVKRRVAFHPRTPRLEAMRLARELYLMDLVQLSLLPSVPGDLRHIAEDLVLARLPQLPLGQKMTLARRGSARVAAGLLVEAQPQLVRLALDNAFLTEAQVLKVLAREKLRAHVVDAIARHPKWRQVYNVRMALVRHPGAPLARVLAFLPDLAVHDLDALRESGSLSESLRRYIEHEIARRSAGEGDPRRTG